MKPEQGTLWGSHFRPPPYQKGSETSEDAAQRVESKASTLRARTYRYLVKLGPRGATDDEIQVASGMNPSTQRPRRVELVRAGLVRDSGRKRRTRSGRQATVWVVKEAR